MKQEVKELIHYDIYLFVLIVTLAMGNYGGSLQFIRLLAIMFIPIFVIKIRECMDYMKIYLTFFISFYLFCLVSLLWTPDIQEAGLELFYYPVHFLIFAEILVFSRFAKYPLRTISLAWLFSVGVTLPIAAWEILTGNHLPLSYFDSESVNLKTEGGSFLRPFAAVTFGNFNGYVTFLCFAFPFLFYYFFQSRRNSIQFVVSISIIVVAIAIILINASRGGLLSIAIMISILFLMTKWNVYKIFFLVLTAIVLFVFVIPQTDELLLALTVRTEEGVSSDEGRIEIWSNAIKAIIDYCFIGTGIGGVTSVLRQLNTHTPITHNMLLEIAVQYGVIFLSIFLIFLLNLYIRAKYYCTHYVKMTLYMALFAFPVYSIINSGYLLTPFVHVAFSCLCVFAYIKKIEQKQLFI